MNQELQQLLYEGAQSPSTSVLNDRLNRLIRALSSAGAITSDDVSNLSTVTGANVTAALDWLKANSGGVQNNIATIDPTVNDDSGAGYSVKSWWFNDVALSFWICEDATVGAAVWTALATGGGSVNSVTGNIVDNTDPVNPVVTQQQADWNEADNTKPDFILNKPAIASRTFPVRITAADFTGNDYTNALLTGLTAQVDFDVWSASGTGGLLNVNDGYTFNSGAGTLTTSPDNYLILIY